MNIAKIQVNGQYLWIDKDSKIKEGDILPYVLCWSNGIYELVNSNNGIRRSKIPFAKKVIESSSILNTYNETFGGNNE